VLGAKVKVEVIHGPTALQELVDDTHHLHDFHGAGLDAKSLGKRGDGHFSFDDTDRNTKLREKVRFKESYWTSSCDEDRDRGMSNRAGRLGRS
jgi:hypothetical protein